MYWFSKALLIAISGALLVALPSTKASAQPRHRVVIIQRVPVVDPFFAYPYPYAYPPNYVESNYGYVKLDTDRKDASVYIDGGYADKIKENKKFALRPGNHDIELRDSDGRTIYQQRVAVIVGKTTKLELPS
jgi:hypothetical protein